MYLFQVIKRFSVTPSSSTNKYCKHRENHPKLVSENNKTIKKHK